MTGIEVFRSVNYIEPTLSEQHFLKLYEQLTELHLQKCSEYRDRKIFNFKNNALEIYCHGKSIGLSNSIHFMQKPSFSELTLRFKNVSILDKAEKQRAYWSDGVFQKASRLE